MWNKRSAQGLTGKRYARPMKLERWRVWTVVGVLMLLFSTLLVRSVYLQVFSGPFLKEQGEARYARSLQLEANRGMITDRNGDPLAVSTPVESIWASPRSILLLPAGQQRNPNWEPENEKDPIPVALEEVDRLAKVLGVSFNELKRKLSETRKNAKGEAVRPDFVWLRRHMAPIDAKTVLALNMPGIYSQHEYRRYYPAGEMLAHVVGFTDIDGKGQEGFELTKESILAGKPGQRNVIRDRQGYIVEDISTIVPPQQGETFALSIDRRIQYLAYKELQQAIRTAQAIGGAVVVLDAQTGEVLALANAPSYNPNSRQKIDPAKKRNRALTDVYEPGSTMKPITVAAGLEAGKVNPQTLIDTQGGLMKVGSALIHDVHKDGILSVAQVVQRSSNVGAVKIALMLDRPYFWNFLHEIGFGQAPHTGFPGEVAGRLRPWKRWVPIDQATMGFGHGISVSLMQMAKAYQMFTTDGEIRPITLTKVTIPFPGKPVIKPETASAVRKMLEMVTQTETSQARVTGYRVAGKTGTSHKLERGVYVKKYVASFIGFAPVSDPRLIIAIMIDEPHQRAHFGGQVAAPMFSRLMAGSLRILGIPPDMPVADTILEKSTPASTGTLQ